MNKEKPLISIMMPVYNGQDTLPRAIQSLLYQTYSNWRCIIVNDGSSDGTRAYLDSLIDKRFQVIHLEKNQGRPFARQVALDAAEGKYLAFLDADDFYHSLKLEKQLEIMEQHPHVLLTSCANGSYNGAFELETVRGKGAGMPVRFKIEDPRNVVLRTSMVKLDIAKKHKFNVKLKLAEDTDFIERMLDHRYFYTMKEVLYYYSEFASVTKAKILQTNYYGLYIFFTLFKNKPAYYAKKIIVNCFKITVKVLVYPFVSVDFYLRKRGSGPSAGEIEAFNKSMSDLNKINNKYVLEK